MMGNKIHGRTVVSIAILLALAIIIPIYVAHYHPATKAQVSTTTELVFADANKGEIYIADASGRQVSKAPYPKYSYLSFQAVAPNGAILAAINSGSPDENFIYTRENASQIYSGNEITALHATPILGTSHQVFLTDSKTVLFEACQNGGSCKLEKQDLSNGKMTQVMDLGVKLANPAWPPAYLLGFNRTDDTAYIRVMGAKTKLGPSQDAVYRVDIGGSKVIDSFDIPSQADLAATVSPDGSKLAYVTLDAKRNQTINILDFNTKQTQKLAWSYGPLANEPAALAWSAGSDKLLVESINLAGPNSQSTSTVLACINIASKKLTVLKSISDPTSEQIADFGWLDNSVAVYQIMKTDHPRDFTNASAQTFRQTIGSNTPALINVPGGSLLQAATY